MQPGQVGPIVIELIHLSRGSFSAEVYPTATFIVVMHLPAIARFRFALAIRMGQVRNWYALSSLDYVGLEL